MAATFKYYFSNERPFWEKRGALIRGRRSLNISRQNGNANSREALFWSKVFFRINTVSSMKNVNANVWSLTGVMETVIQILNINKIDYYLDLLSNMYKAWRRDLACEEKIKCYTMPLPRLSYLYWVILFKGTMTYI